jgi:hypothetical protein
MAIVFMMNKEIAHGMVCFFHQKKHSYLIILLILSAFKANNWHYWYFQKKFLYFFHAILSALIKQKFVPKLFGRNWVS